MGTHISGSDIQVVTACQVPKCCQSVDFSFGRDDLFFFFLKCLLEISKSKLDFQAPFIALVSVKAKTVLHSILENVHNFGRREQIILVNKSHYLRARFVCPHLHSRLGNGLSLDDKKKIEAHS